MFSSIKNAFVAGELSPSVFGRIEVAKWHDGASTMRNCFVRYTGGASSRAGLAYVGMCKQAAPNSGGTSTNNPPRDIQFQFSINQGYALEFGDQYMRIKSNGSYVVETGKTITAATNANPLVITSAAHGFSNNDWVFISGMGGMTQLNNLTWIVTNVTTNTFHLTDLFGNTVNSTSYGVFTSGGTAARIYTVVSPYAAVDLPYLKFTQSADTMSLTCVNQQTLTEYPPYELVRSGNTSWAFTQTTYTASILPPTNVAVTAQSSATLNTWYSYQVTAVSAATGEESIASSAVSVQNNNISINAGTNTITWNAVTGADSYNIYKTNSVYSTSGTSPIAVGVPYGYLGTAFGASFTDSNIDADSTRSPPVHNDPFARGAINGVVPTNGGSGYDQATIGYTITTSTGSGFSGTPVVVNGAFVAFIITNAGKLYQLGDTITITGGTGGTATLTIGPETGTYPGTVAYYQQRRGYGNTTDEPDTYFFSQPGAFTNMDSSIPITDGDAIIGTPWAQQINGIQFMVPMPGGLIILTGNGAWQLNGGNSAALTPADQTATAQSYNGCNATIPPIVVNYDILYVQAKGSIVRDLSYSFFVNIYTGADVTVFSNHLFNFHQILQWAYAQEPFKIIWAVRTDGTMLSLTYLKEQDVNGWARHDTNGQFVSVCSVTEPPVDAVYSIVRRYIVGHGVWAYYAERMDNRNWETVEDCFCVDAGLSYPMTFPNAILTPAAATGTNNISSTNIVNGGSSYIAPTARAVDSTGAGIGATFSVTVVGGVITAIPPILQGQNYTPGATKIVITDSTGSGAVAVPVITNNVVFTTSTGVFNSGMVGNVIRIGNNNNGSISFTTAPTGGGKAIITAYNSATSVTANIIEPITNIILDDPNNLVAPVNPNYWSISVPTSVVTGLNHLEGMQVSILADGSVVANQTVVNGSVTLPESASAITIGLPFIAQVQTMYLEPPGQPNTTQNKRKNIYAVTARVESSRGFTVGTNEPDASTEPNQVNIPWTDMKEVKQRNALITPGSAIPLFTGDIYINVPADWDAKGQVAFQQIYPLPLNLNACVSWYQIGDSSA